jgi:hypothetical protein
MGTPSTLETSLQDQLAVLEVAATGYVSNIRIETIHRSFESILMHIALFYNCKLIVTSNTDDTTTIKKHWIQYQFDLQTYTWVQNVLENTGT